MILTNEQILEKVKTKIDPSQLVCLMRFGSHLYGTNTEASDTDIKGVYIPKIEDYLNLKVIKSIHIDSNKSDTKNTEEDYDIELFSLNHFIKLACEGQTVAIDMLYANTTVAVPFRFSKEVKKDSPPLLHSIIWFNILCERDKFLQKDLNAFVGYAQKQAAKYGLKGSRMDAVKKYLDFFDDFDFSSKDMERIKLAAIWDRLPKGEHIAFDYCEKSKLKYVEVCQRKLQETVSIQYAYDCLKKVYDAYGERARQAQTSEGVDGKAICHALRAAYELEELYIDPNEPIPPWDSGLTIRICPMISEG